MKQNCSAKNKRGVQVARILTRRDAMSLGAAALVSVSVPGRAAQATFDYYISPNGNNNNPGTLSQPWALTALNSKRSTYAGKTVGLLDGVYNLIAIMGQPTSGWDTGSLGIAGGTSASPTVIRAVNSRQAIIDWNRAAQTNTSEGATFQPVGRYVTIDGLTLRNNNYCAIVNVASGGDNLTIKNCLFQGQSFERNNGSTGKNSCMVYTQGYNHILISNCRFEGGGAPADLNRHSVIETYQPTNDCVIEYCTFIAGPQTGNLIYFKQGDNTGVVVRNCFMDRSASTTSIDVASIAFDGTRTRSTDRARFHNNIMIAGRGRANIWSAGGFSGVFDIYHNTMVGDWGSNGCYRDMHTGSPAQVNIYENIHARSGASGTYGDVAVSSIGTIGNVNRNRYPASPRIAVGGGPSAAYSSLAAWQSASGADSNSSTGDPQFVGSGTLAEYYRLRDASPCKTMASDRGEIGAWRGATQIGSTSGGTPLQTPRAPDLTGVT